MLSLGPPEPVLAGVDGCRAGWVVALPSRVVVVPHFADVLAMGAAVVAVDMPIGLSDTGPRRCDVEARRLLGPRRSSVFPSPARAVLAADGWEDALARSRAATGRGLSLQAWNLVRKIAEVDAGVGPDDEDRVVEAHPELSLATLAGAPMTYPKRTPAGRAERLAALAVVFPAVSDRLAEPHPGAADDDVLDAHAVLWTAHRVAAGTATTLGDGQRDARGLRMAITT